MWLINWLKNNENNIVVRIVEYLIIITILAGIIRKIVIFVAN